VIFYIHGPFPNFEISVRITLHLSFCASVVLDVQPAKSKTMLRISLHKRGAGCSYSCRCAAHLQEYGALPAANKLGVVQRTFNSVALRIPELLPCATVA
jgi:hypothetical protein